eukprot:14342129-Alexandrium_andersonii.AAC.1
MLQSRASGCQNNRHIARQALTNALDTPSMGVVFIMQLSALRCSGIFAMFHVQPCDHASIA